MEYGTARLLRTNFIEEPVLGKTGTCSKDGTRFGWFGSYANTQYGRIVTVIFLEGGRPTFGPKAAELAGRLYRNLYDHEFFAVKPPTTPVRTAGSEVNPAATWALRSSIATDDPHGDAANSDLPCSDLWTRNTGLGR